AQWAPSPNFSEIPCGHLEIMGGGAAVADYDGDGWVDIFLPRVDLPNQLWRNQGDGTFVEVAAEVGLDRVGSSNGAAFGDVDDDGDLDLVVTFMRAENTEIFINDGTGHFTAEGSLRIPPVES